MAKKLSDLALNEVIKAYRVDCLYVQLRPENFFFESYWGIEVETKPRNIVFHKVTLPSEANICEKCLRFQIVQKNADKTHPCD